jgi:FkbM family methyltransferase
MLSQIGYMIEQFRTVCSEQILNYLHKFPLKRGKYRLAVLASSLLDGSVITSVYGPKLHARFKDSTFWLMARYGNECCYRYLQDLSSGDIFVDVGANIGLFTLFAASHCKQVIALEPSRREFVDLLQNIQLNACRNVVPLLLAASNRSGIVQINVNPIQHSGGNSILSVTEKLSKNHVVAITLDQLLTSVTFPEDQANSACPSLSQLVVKIDVEGFEPQVILGMERLLKSGMVRKVIVEIDEDRQEYLSNTDCDVYEIMDKHGFIPMNGKQKGHYDECFAPSGTFSKH